MPLTFTSGDVDRFTLDPARVRGMLVWRRAEEGQLTASGDGFWRLLGTATNYASLVCSWPVCLPSPALDHVVREAGHDDSGDPGHVAIITACGAASSIISTTTPILTTENTEVTENGGRLWNDNRNRFLTFPRQ